ncbi:MAG: TrkA family potassium uptake protein [Pseudomonadales bacterium]|nr:TrkA family potassium uptake protein [Pseudomonadales bacterium]
MSKRRQRSFVVIGLGTFGRTVSTELARYGDHVLGIDIDEHKVSSLSDILAEAVIADGRDEDALRETGAGNYDVALVAIGEDLEANILCTMNLKQIGVPCVWVKALDRVHHRILSRLDVDKVIHPEQEIGQHIAQMLHNPLVRDYINIGNGFFIVDFTLPEQLDGQQIATLELMEKFNIRCLGLLRHGEFLPCEAATTILKTDDKLLLFGDRSHLRAFGETL